MTAQPLNSAEYYIDQVYRQLKENNFKGYDPFDGLNSRLFNMTPLKYSRFCRLAWLQFNKRSLINFRPITFTPKRRNTKGIALVVLGLLQLEKQRSDVLSEAIELGEWLLSQQCKGWEGTCWGYPFAWQARAFYVPEGKPNLIATAYVARALRALGERTGRCDFLNAANQVGAFIFKYLINKSEHGIYFSYIPGETALVHNANLWAGVILAQAAVSTDNQMWLETALNAVQLTVDAQRPDGSWVYGGRHHHQFIDGFHSGYNLEALSHLQNLLGDQRYQSSINAGFDFYITNCFDADGAPTYYANQPYPIDTHSVAQALVTFRQLNVSLEYDERVMRYAIQNLYDAKARYFYYQKTNLGLNKICYGRWVQSWMFYGLCAHYSQGYPANSKEIHRIKNATVVA